MEQCILQITDQYTLAYHGVDTEFYVCKMTNGKVKRMNDSDHQLEIEEFFEDQEVYWRKNGWHVVVKDDKRVLTPVNHNERPSNPHPKISTK